MGIGTIKVGQRFDLDGKRQHITRLLDGQRIEFEDAESARRQELTQTQLLDLYNQGRLIFRPIINIEADKRARSRVLSNVLLASLSPIQRKVASLRLHFINKLAGVPTTRTRCTPLVQALWNKLKVPERELMPACPHASTVARWMRQYRDADCNIVALTDQHALKGNRERIPAKVQDFMEDCVRDTYLTPQRRNITSVLADINSLIDDTNLMLIQSEHLAHVSYEQLRKYISGLPAYDVFASRYGKQAADMKFRTTGKGANAALPLQRAAMDHCRLDLFVVDAETGLPLGRPWLTAIIDECTRMILGFSLSFDEPSALTVMRALRHAILPKAGLDDVTQPWPAWGIMRTLVVDNGLEFHGESLDYAAGQFGITIQTCPRRQPWFKGKIERFHRTIQTDLVALIPGRTFSSIFERRDYDSSKHAAITLETLNRVIRLWIVDVYHQSIHSSLDQSPARKWDTLIDQVDRHLPDSAQWVDAAFGKPAKRVLGHEGVLFDSLAYNSAELGGLRRRLGDRISVNIITNDEDVGYLYVVCPETGAHIKSPAVNQDYAKGLTRWQHTKCREYSKLLSEQEDNRVNLSDAKARIIELIEQDMRVNHRKTRSKQARAHSMVKANQIRDPMPAPVVAPKAASSMAYANSSIPLQSVIDDEILDLTAGTAAQYFLEIAA